MIYALLTGLALGLAWIALVLALLVPVLRDGRTPARTPGDIPPGWTRNERGALVPPVPHSPQKHAPKHTPKHVATERIHAGGRYIGTLPRRDALPLTEQTIIVQRPGRPWDTAANPALDDDAETLRLGGWGTMPAERVIAAELPQVIA